MIPVYATADGEHKRLKFIDNLITYGSPELDDVMEAEAIIRKLKGQPDVAGVIQRLLDSHNQMINEIYQLRTDKMNLQTDVMALKNDFKDLIKAVSVLYNPQPLPYSQELNNLKQKNYIY